MKIKEITLRENYKITSIDPNKGAEITDPTNPNYKFTVPTDQLIAMQNSGNKFTVNPAALPNAQGQQAVTSTQPTTTTAQPQGQQAVTSTQPTTTTAQPQGQQSTTTQPLPQPQIGSEIEIAATETTNDAELMGSEVELTANEQFNNKDLMKSGVNKPIGGPSGGDRTNDFIDDVTDHDFEKQAGRNHRNTVHVKESDELIAMLTIAGLR